MKTRIFGQTTCLCLALVLGFGAVDAAWALCPVGKAREAAGIADEAYEAYVAAMAAVGQSATEVGVVLSEPGQAVTATPGQAPGEGLSDQDKAVLDGIAVDREAWIPN